MTVLIHFRDGKVLSLSRVIEVKRGSEGGDITTVDSGWDDTIHWNVLRVEIYP